MTSAVTKNAKEAIDFSEEDYVINIFN